MSCLVDTLNSVFFALCLTWAAMRLDDDTRK